MKPIRKDPAGFKTTELANARILVGIVNDFEELILRTLERLNGRALAPANLNDLVTIRLGKPSPLASPKFTDANLGQFYENAGTLEAYLDKTVVKPAAKKIVASSVAHGRAWADKSLGAFGITTTAPQYTNAKTYYLPPEQRMIDMYQAKVATEIKGLTSYQSTNIQRAIAEGFRAGETVKQIAKRVQAVTPMAKNKAITIARTETLAAGNAAAKERYAAAGVEMLEWVAALDDRVCPECTGLHGKTYPIGETPDIPVHPNCRCTLVPYREKE
jgi:SPP1 gp7 family putative phage head morphogenesis protein